MIMLLKPWNTHKDVGASTIASCKAVTEVETRWYNAKAAADMYDWQCTDHLDTTEAHRVSHIH